MRWTALAQILACSLLITLAAGDGRAQPTAEPVPAQEPAPSPDQGQIQLPDQEPAAPAAEAAAQAKQASGEGGAHTIKQGDTLWDISHFYLKDPFLWPLIWKVNPSIANPDLIYPGTILVIPGLAPIERAMQAPKAAAEETALEEPMEEEVAAREPMPRRTRPTRQEPETEEDVPATGPRLIVPEEGPMPILDKYTMLSAGFIDEPYTDDRIVGSLEPKTVFSYDDIVYISLPSQEKVALGDKFTIFKPLKSVQHPETGESYGRLIKVLGILRVTAMDMPEVLTARITLSFDAIEKGSLLTPYVEPSLIYPGSKRKAKDLAGYILEVVDNRSINAQTDIVYLDIGSIDGVEPGDRFSVYTEPQGKVQPRKLVGEVQVFLVKEVSSTAMVRKSVDTLAKGDVVESSSAARVIQPKSPSKSPAKSSSPAAGAKPRNIIIP